MSSIPRFYVYVLARPNGKPFYVGKGTTETNKDRLYDHEREARGGHRCHKCNVIRKIWRQGGKVQSYTVFATNDEQEAFDYEVATIAMYDLETLCNQTIGGDGGMTGMVYSEKQRAAIKSRAVKNAQDPEWRRRVSVGTKAAFDANPDIRKKLTEGLHERYADPEYREKHRAATTAANQKPERRQRVSEGGKNRFNDPEQRRRQADQLRALNRNPERRQQKAIETQQQWQNPETREGRLRGLRQGWGAAEYQYILVSPSGEKFVTNNLNAFCKEYGLHQGHMYEVVRGEERQHKGWTGIREIVKE